LKSANGFFVKGAEISRFRFESAGPRVAKEVGMGNPAEKTTIAPGATIICQRKVAKQDFS
jgi:hypothetical protein